MGQLNPTSAMFPIFFPGEHYGDYIELSISEKGKVRKMKPTDEEIDELLGE